MGAMQPPDHALREELALANRGFYEVFQRLDFDAMRALWLDSPSIRCVHPGCEALIGPECVHASWRAIFTSTKAIHFKVGAITLELHGTTGVVGCIERLLDGELPPRVESIIAATNVFVRRNGRWLMSVHHASPIERRFFPESV